MKLYNKLYFAIMTVICTQHSHSISIEPIQLHSSIGELLYAEINFQQANINMPINVSLAQPEDLQFIGIQHAPPNDLNFFVRKLNDGTGVITITSSKPMTSSHLNIVIKIKEGSNIRLQHLLLALSKYSLENKNQLTQSNQEKLLSPIFVINEQDIALNLPRSNQNNELSTTSNHEIASVHFPEQSLVISKALPPVLNSELQREPTEPKTNQIKILAIGNRNPSQPLKFSSSKDQQTIPRISQLQNQMLLTQLTTERSLKISNNPPPTLNNISTVPYIEPIIDPFDLLTSNPSISSHIQTSLTHLNVESPLTHITVQYTVQKNDSLWKIASQILTKKNHSIHKIMTQIKVDNQHAFIHGDIHKLKKGAILAINTSYQNIKTTKNNVLAQKNIKNYLKSEIKYSGHLSQLNLMTRNVSYHFQMLTQET